MAKADLPRAADRPVYPGHERKAAERDPARRSPRAQRNAAPRGKIREVRTANRGLCGARKVWFALDRLGIKVARCTVERWIARDGAAECGAQAEKIVTTNPDTARPCPDDTVNRVFRAERPNQLWGEPLSAIGSSPMATASDFTCVPTWSGTVYVAARPLFLNQWRTRSRSSMSSRGFGGCLEPVAAPA